MLDMVRNPLLALFDRDFLAYAGNSILSKTVVAFMGIWMACVLFDMVTDKDTRPSRKHLVIRGILAFLVPLGIITATEQSQTMPSTYRLYQAGSYAIGKDLPAGTYAVSRDGSHPSVTIEGDKGKTSQKWTSGTMSVTVYDGDTLTLDGCYARNRTASQVYNANAVTSGIANGTRFFLGGADLRPGTYEITSTSDDSEYEVRDGYVKLGYGLSPTPTGKVAYADVHYGEVLYVRDASVILYSNVFALPKEEEGEDDEKANAEDSADGEKPKEGQTNEGEGAEDPTDPQDQATAGSQSQAGDEPIPAEEPQAPESTESDGQGTVPENAVMTLRDRISVTPWKRDSYVPMEATDGTARNDATTFHGLLQKGAV